jgi:predicted HNH restriction endonuclease
MTWSQSVEDALLNLGGVAFLRDIYAEVRRLRSSTGETVPPSIDAVIRKELEYNSSDSSTWTNRRDLFYSVDGIGNGVWGLRSKLPTEPVASDINGPDESIESATRIITVNRIVRDTAMTRKVKALHNSTCQVCGNAVKLPDGSNYAEAHHIIPIGSPHNGPDRPNNIVVVCPNHHAMLDFGCVRLEVSKLSVAKGHTLAAESLDYHNTRIFAERS